jgi:hypothetical protein
MRSGSVSGPQDDSHPAIQKKTMIGRSTGIFLAAKFTHLLRGDIIDRRLPGSAATGFRSCDLSGDATLYRCSGEPAPSARTNHSHHGIRRPEKAAFYGSWLHRAIAAASGIP